MIGVVTATVDSGVPHSDGSAFWCSSPDCGAALTCQMVGTCHRKLFVFYLYRVVMRRVWDAFREFRGTRLANVLVSIFSLLWGLYVVLTRSGVVGLTLGGFFVVVGVLGLYNQLLGEPMTEAVKRQL